MDLWNEYEGRSIAGLFPLERLIRPEGRSAFFSTTTSGTSTVIRLIESHFDEEEILARWTTVSDLHQPNLLTLTRFGQAIMDETSLVYVVLEPTEADLSQILCERPLTLAETRQVASGLIPALQALHAKGFIHEHIEAANVLAVGEVVKLRSDCIRETPEGAEGIALQQCDIKDLATLLLQALTQHRDLSVAPKMPQLQEPLLEIIHNGISGTWTLAQMANALETTAPKPIGAMQTAPVTADLPVNTIRQLHRPGPVVGPTSAPAAVRISVPEAPVQRQINPPYPFPESAAGRIRVPIGTQSNAPRRWLAGLAFAVICLMLFAVSAIVRRHRSNGEATIESAAQSDSTLAQRNIPKAIPAVSQPAPPVVEVAKATQRSVDAASRADWRVVIYTYNNRGQAAAKARALDQRFRSLHPVVFSLSGRAPFLVTLGGPLNRDSALRLRDKLRASGLPRDLYAQNYSKAR